MNLSIENYNHILQIYENTRLSNEKILSKRYAEVTNKLPRIAEINLAISNLYIAQAKKNISSKKSNFDSSDTMFNALLSKLEDEKRTLLINNGYDETYLDKIFTCKLCNDTGYINGKPCSCFQKNIIKYILNKENNPFLTDEVSFNEFNLDYYPSNYIYKNINKTPREIATISLERATTFCLNFDKNYRNLLITGDTGVGKTYLASAISTAITKRGFFVMYLSSIELFEQLNIYRYSYNDKYSKDEISKSLLIKSGLDKCDLLIIDDLGSEINQTTTNSELYNIIEKRDHLKKSTIITTNLSLENIKSIYSERIYSRIYKNYDRIILVGDDIRIIQKHNNLSKGDL